MTLSPELDTINAIRIANNDEEAVRILRKNKMVYKLHIIELLHKHALKASSIETLDAIEEIQKELLR
jgi:hypothetical protein